MVTLKAKDEIFGISNNAVHKKKVFDLDRILQATNLSQEKDGNDKVHYKNVNTERI